MKPKKRLMVVVLPAPFCPSKQKISPGLTQRFRFLSAGVPLYDFERLIASSMLFVLLLMSIKSIQRSLKSNIVSKIKERVYSRSCKPSK
jgi:hypothetical protein